MRRTSLRASAVLFATLFANPGLGQELSASRLSHTELEDLVTRLAQAEPDPATDCAACIADCGHRYGRVCNLLCHPYSVCSAMCAERRVECTQECRTDLSCRTRRSCQLAPERGGLVAR